MKTWSKPEFYVESFELTQTIATGCTTLSENYIGKVMSSGCEKKPGELHNANSYSTPEDPNGGHILASVEIKDANGDGKISQSEWNTAVSAVLDLFHSTGVGHLDHSNSNIFIDDVNISTITGLFSS